jgi:hypothetical protein
MYRLGVFYHAAARATAFSKPRKKAKNGVEKAIQQVQKWFVLNIGFVR